VERPRVFITRRLAVDPASVLGAGIEIDLHDSELAPPRADLLRRAHDAAALVPMVTDRIDAEVIEASPRLRIVANHGVGYDNVDVSTCTRRGI